MGRGQVLLSFDGIFRGQNMNKCLDIGCGPKKHEGCTGIDHFAYEGVDVVCNLNDLPWPFEDDTFDEIYAHSVIEHLDNFIKVMEEIHRVSKPGAVVHIIVPYYRFVNAYSPAHKTFFTEYTFRFLTEELPSEIHDMTNARFKLLKDRYIVTITLFEYLPTRAVRIIDSIIGGIISDLDIDLGVIK
jgi:SAM-dependent methyltransferase